eukprot:3515944-Rhodomonas_salina.1
MAADHDCDLLEQHLLFLDVGLDRDVDCCVGFGLESGVGLTEMAGGCDQVYCRGFKRDLELANLIFTVRAARFAAVHECLSPVHECLSPVH